MSDGITAHEDGSIVIDTPTGIKLFQLLAIRGRLQIEVRTGLKSRVSTLAAAKQLYGVVSNTKKGALAEIEAFVLGVDWSKGLPVDEAKLKPLRLKKHAVEAAAFERGFHWHKSLTS